MKKILALILVAALAVMAQNTRQRYHLTFCTTVSGIDYCAEHEAMVKFNFDGDDVTVSRYGDVIFAMKRLSQWKFDPATGDSTTQVYYNGVKWDLIARDNSYVMDDHRCSIVEFWHGPIDDQRAFHGYVQTDLDDMFAFSERCEINHGKRPKKTKSKKYDSNRLILGAIFNGDSVSVN